MLMSRDTVYEKINNLNNLKMYYKDFWTMRISISNNAAFVATIIISQLKHLSEWYDEQTSSLNPHT